MANNHLDRQWRQTEKTRNQNKYAERRLALEIESRNGLHNAHHIRMKYVIQEQKRIRRELQKCIISPEEYGKSYRELKKDTVGRTFGQLEEDQVSVTGGKITNDSTSVSATRHAASARDTSHIRASNLDTVPLHARSVNGNESKDDNTRTRSILPRSGQPSPLGFKGAKKERARFLQSLQYEEAKRVTEKVQQFTGRPAALPSSQLKSDGRGPTQPFSKTNDTPNSSLPIAHLDIRNARDQVTSRLAPNQEDGYSALALPKSNVTAFLPKLDNMKPLDAPRDRQDSTEDDVDNDERNKSHTFIPTIEQNESDQHTTLISSAVKPPIDTEATRDRLSNPIYDPESYNPDGSLRTMHTMPSMAERFKEAKKARYLRVRTKDYLDNERELTVDEVFQSI